MTSTGQYLQPPTQTTAAAAVSTATTTTTPARPFVLVPLYIYPTPAAWEPLYGAAAAHPDLDFYVVVNPANGPGAGALPDANYVDALVRLTALRNVKVLGYVYCSYGNRLTEDVVADIEAYARWEGEMAKGGDGKTIVVDGIFIDETPSSTEFVQYMATLANAGKTILNRNVLVPAAAAAAAAGGGSGGEGDSGSGAIPVAVAAAAATGDGVTTGGPTEAAGDTTPLPDASSTSPSPTPPGGALTPSASSAVVIYNPGVVVDPIFYQAADYVVAFENAAQHWASPVVSQGFARLPPPLAQRSVAVAHSSAPAEVVGLSRRAAETGCAGQFVTSSGGYTEWCPVWDEFVGEMARRARV